MASLLTASSSACICSRHEETETVEVDCHSHHESSDFDIKQTNAFDEGCACSVEQPLPRLGSKTENNDLKINSVLKTEQALLDLKFVAVGVFYTLSPDFTRRLSYSNTLKSLIPARAPPRL